MPQNKEMTFADALKRFVGATANGMKYATICAMMGLRHAAETGDFVYCQAFMDAMPKNYVRKAAFVAWLVEFSPAELKGGKFVKDKSETANAFNIEAADKITFWDFKPVKDPKNYSSQDAIAAVLKVLDGFENAKRFKAGDETAHGTVVQLRQLVKNIAPAGNITEPSAAIAAHVGAKNPEIDTLEDDIIVDAVVETLDLDTPETVAA